MLVMDVKGLKWDVIRTAKLYARESRDKAKLAAAKQMFVGRGRRTLKSSVLLGRRRKEGGRRRRRQTDGGVTEEQEMEAEQNRKFG